MITLATGGTLKGKAGTATAVTYTILGDAKGTSANVYQVLGQGQLPTVTPGDLLTTTPVPASTAYLIKEIHLANATGSNVTGIVFYVNGTAAANQITGTITIPANGTAVYDGSWHAYDASGIEQYVGSTGPSGTMAVGTVSNVGSAGPPTITNVGTAQAAVLNFGLQQGIQGNTGAAGVVQDVLATDASIVVGGTTAHPTIQRAALTGDVTATAGSNATTVAKIQGVAVDVTAPTNGQVLQLVSGSPNKWIPESYGGDVQGGPSAAVVAAIQSRPVSSATPAVSQLLQYGPSSVWTPSTFIYNVVNFGADPSGTADSLAAINAAIAAAQIAAYAAGSGGVVWFPAGRYKITAPIVITGSNIKLWGVGGGSSLDFGTYYTGMGSTIVPNGAFKAIQVIPVQTLGVNGNPNVGFGIKGVGVDCYASNGTIGLQLISCQNFEIDDFYSINATDCALDFNTLPAGALTLAATWPLAAATVTVNSTAASGSGVAFPANTNTAGSFVLADGTGAPRLVTYTGGSATTFTGCSSAGAGTGTTAIGGFVRILPGAQDCTRGKIGIINVRAIDGGAGSGIAIRMNGDAGGTANTCLNNFVGPVKIAHLNGVGVKDINSDTNYFDFMVINRAGGGSGVGCEIGAAATPVGASRNNVFGNVSFGAGGLTCRGTPTATFPSGPTYVNSYQIANGEVLPTLEAGALLYWHPNAGFWPGIVGNPATAAQAAITGATTAVTGTVFAVPPLSLQVGTTFKWTILYTQTITAVANSLTIRYGSTGTGADTAVATWSQTGTAASATQGKVEVYFTVLTTGASGTFYARAYVINPTATGIFGPVLNGTVATTAVAALDTTAPQSAVRFLSAAFTTAAANTITPQAAWVECLKAANP